MLKYYTTAVLAFLFVLLIQSNDTRAFAHQCVNGNPSYTEVSKANMPTSANVQAKDYVNTFELANETYFVKRSVDGFATTLNQMKQP